MPGQCCRASKDACTNMDAAHGVRIWFSVARGAESSGCQHDHDVGQYDILNIGQVDMQRWICDKFYANDI